MICPICKIEFTIYDYALTVSCQQVYFCGSKCQAEAKKILIYNRSQRSKRVRALIREMLKQSERKEIKPVKKESPKEEAKQESKKKFKSFGFRLAMERYVAGLSIKELAEAVGVESETIELLEEGIVTPTNFILTKIAEVLGISKGKLMPTKKK